MKRARASGEGTTSPTGKGEEEESGWASGGKGGGPELGPDESALGLRVHEWGLNPLFWSYVKLFARDVHGLGTLEGIDDSHVLHGKAAHRVEVLGTVVHVKPGATKAFGSYVKYIIDDGTGLLPCTQYERNASSGSLRNGHAERHELGELLVVQGRLKRYRGAREVVITSARKPADPNEEVLHWLRCVELRKTVYAPRFRRSEYVDDDLVMRSSQARPTRCDCGATYAEAIGYCRCVAPPLALDPAFEFRDALLTRLAAREESLPPKEHLRFQFARDVRDDPFLGAAANRVVSALRSGGVSSDGAGVPVTRRRKGPIAQDTREAGNNPVPTAGLGVPAQGDGGGSDGVVGQQKGKGTAVVKAKVIELLRSVMSSLHRDGALHFSDKAADVYVLISRGRVLQPGVEAVCRERGLGLTQENEIIRALQGAALFHHVSGARIRACVHRMKKSAQPGSS